MKRNRIALVASMFVVPLLVILALPAVAADQTGRMNGTVFDPDGVPLAGVTVTVSSEVLMGTRQSQTADDGSFLFFGLPPGKYSIEIEQSGFLPFKQQAIPVKLGGTVSMDILLEVPTAEETVVVTARHWVVDREKSNLGQNYDDEFLEEVPVGRNYTTIAQLAPGVTGGDNPNVHGSSLYGNQYLIDGINTTDPATQTWSTQFNFDAIKEVQILTGGLDAEYGFASGGILNVVTKSGGNEFHVDTSFYLTPNWLRLKDDFEKEALGENNTYNYNLNVSGPIVKDKLWYFVSLEASRVIASQTPTENFFDPADPDLLQHPSWKTWGFLYLAKLTWQVSEKHKLTAVGQGDPSWFQNVLQDPQVAPEAEEKRWQFGGFYSLAWEAIWSRNLFQRTQVGVKYSGMLLEPMSGCKSADDEECRRHIDQRTGNVTGNYDRHSLDHRYRIQADSALSYYLDNLAGDHEVKLGFNYARLLMDSWLVRPGGGIYTDQDGQPYRLSRIIPDENGEIQPYTDKDNGHTLGVYLQDSWKILKNFSLKPGLRFDWVQINNFEDRAIIEYKTLSPRINLVWDATGDGKTVVRAGYNRYVDPGWFNVSGFLGSRKLKTEVLGYNPDTGKYDIPVSSTADEQGVVGSDNNTAPHCDEFSLQVERELFTDFSLGVNGLYREFKYQFEDVEVNEIWNHDGTDKIGYKSSRENYIYQTQNPREAWRRYWGIELVARKAFSDNWQMMGSYTYSRAQGSIEGYWTAFLDNPQQDQFYWSWLSFDQRHVIKIDSSYHLPYGFELGANLTWQTGQPYSKIFQGYQGGWSNYQEKIGYDPNHPNNEYWNRTPDTLMINVKAVWDLKELTGQQFDLIMQMYNIMHLRYKNGLEQIAYPPGSPRQYGQFYGMLPGFRAQLGIRYRY